MLLKLLLSLLSGIGGHYLNRRWDKALFFFSLFALYPVGVYFFFYRALTEGNYQGIDALQRHFSLLFGGGVVLIWLVSLLVTRYDAAKAKNGNLPRWTLTGVVGALFTSLLTAAYLTGSVLLLVNSFNLTGTSDESTTQNENRVYSRDLFYSHLYMGGSSGSSFNHPHPPTGDGLLKGRITFDGEPAVGVRLSLDLNDQYRAGDLVTDSDGFFSVPLKTGTWFINSIQTSSWSGKPPEGDFSLFYEGQARLEGETFDRYGHLAGSGYRVVVSENAAKPQVEIRIGRNISMTWPDQNAEKSEATLEDVIRWQEHPDAENYYVVISHMTRDGDTTTYSPITERLLQQHELPLADLAHAPTDGTSEYSVQVYAFAADGTLVSTSSDSMGKGSFVLAGGQKLVKDGHGFKASTPEETEAYIARMKAVARNRVLLDAVEVLLEEQKLDQAETLLALVDSERAEGKKELFQGAVLALRGECEQAELAFARALEVNPEICVPDPYRGECR
ncbi:MAG: hypothetical protein C0623_11005 [Desulfuromonas sp.]|nr:MAG: hypothetical protein C0623_11005 [Desulfuromonas sp.]